jgi:olefin beta-lactone synthetase
MSLLDIFLATAARAHGKTALIDGQGRALSFGSLADWSGRLALAWQAQGIKRGDRVLLAVPLGHGLYAGLAALWRLGAVAVFPEPAMGLAGLRHAASTTQPVAFLADGWMRALPLVVPELRAARLRLTPTDGDSARAVATSQPSPKDEYPPEHAALISFTSGSTGAPKAIERSHAFLLNQHRAVAPMLVSERHNEADLVAFPVFVLVNLALGTTSVLPCWRVTRHDQADMAALSRFIRQTGVTRLLVPPSICERLPETPIPRQISALFTGGGPVFPDVLQRLRTANPALAMTVVYGSTEAEPIAHLDVATVTANDWAAMRAGGGLLAGHPASEVSLRLDNGEIVVTGGHVNKSYMDVSRNAGTKIVHDGVTWHRTGDAGRLDEQGRLWLLGRLDGKTGDLFPFSIETAARCWPGVRRAALSDVAGGAVLAIEGDPAQRAAWEHSARDLGVARVAVLQRIPLDRRHRSKVDYKALSDALEAQRL